MQNGPLTKNPAEEPGESQVSIQVSECRRLSQTIVPIGGLATATAICGSWKDRSKTSARLNLLAFMNTLKGSMLISFTLSPARLGLARDQVQEIKLADRRGGHMVETGECLAWHHHIANDRSQL
jgi:hypothetical protein